MGVSQIGMFLRFSDVSESSTRRNSHERILQDKLGQYLLILSYFLQAIHRLTCPELSLCRCDDWRDQAGAGAEAAEAEEPGGQEDRGQGQPPG